MGVTSAAYEFAHDHREVEALSLEADGVGPSHPAADEFGNEILATMRLPEALAPPTATAGAVAAAACHDKRERQVSASRAGSGCVPAERPGGAESNLVDMMRLSELQIALESLPPPSKALRQDALPAPAPVPAPAPAHAPAPAPALACAP